jgi:hypothetical protein
MRLPVRVLHRARWPNPRRTQPEDGGFGGFPRVRRVRPLWAACLFAKDSCAPVEKSTRVKLKEEGQE